MGSDNDHLLNVTIHYESAILLYAFDPSDFTHAIDSDVVIIPGYTGTSEATVTPAVIDWYPVREIASSAFRSNTTITSVIIRENVLFIGTRAFAYCSNLRSVTIPDSLIRIDDLAFLHCYSLEEVNLLALTRLADGDPFDGCDKVNAYNVPTHSSNYAFDNGSFLVLI